LNQHPKGSLKWMSSEQKHDYVAFYEQLTDKMDL
jgi:hypothetical protein